MDCTQAQQILSEAVDREPVSPEVFAEVRAHCVECAECARFVQGLAVLQRAAAPEPPASLTDRVMAAVQAQIPADAAVIQRPETGAAETPGGPGASLGPAAAVTGETRPAVAPMAPTPASLAARKRARQRSILAWAGAAAAVFVVAAFAAVYGLRTIVSPSATSTRSSSTPNLSTSDKDLEGPPSGGTAVQPQEGATGSTAATSSVAANFITVNGIAYRATGTLSIDRSQLTTAGTTSSSLGTGRAPQSLTVYTTPTSGQAAVITDTGTLAFQIVTRRLGGEIYALTSQPISAFGIWPSLPSEFIVPTTADGAPTFVAGGQDDLGVKIYVRPGVPVENGFAVGPRTAGSDPAQGNPNWTWWARPTR